MVPTRVRSGQAEAYSNVCPGSSTGCCPTTPGPATSSTRPSPSVIIHRLRLSCTIFAVRFVTRTVYAKKYWPLSGLLRLATYVDITRTLTPSVVTSLWQGTLTAGGGGGGSRDATRSLRRAASSNLSSSIAVASCRFATWCSSLSSASLSSSLSRAAS